MGGVMFTSNPGFPEPSVLTLRVTAPPLGHWFRVYAVSQPCKVLIANWCCTESLINFISHA